MQNKDKLKYLFDKVYEISVSGKNKKILSRWLPDTHKGKLWQGIPLIRHNREKDIPFTINFEFEGFGKLLGFDMKEFYTNPLYQLEQQLKIMIFRFEELDDDTCISLSVPVQLGVTFEPSLFGAETIYKSDSDPWNSKEKVIKQPQDIGKMEFPNFYKSGLMPLAHRFYEEMSSAVPDNFKVIFPTWNRGPYGIVEQLMGFENTMLTLYDDPELFRSILGFVTEANKYWIHERSAFLGVETGKGKMFNDEVNCQVISPGMYKDIIFEYEQDIAEFQNGLTYWHSCGNTVPILPFVKQLKGLDMYDASPWCDLTGAVELLGDTDIAIEARLHPVHQVLYADECTMKGALQNIAETCDGRFVTVRANGLSVMRDVKTDLECIKKWSRVAKETLRKQ